MIRILIYEDDIREKDNLLRLIDDYFTQSHIEYDVDWSNKFTDDYSTLLHYDLVFLDIELGNGNGIDFGIEVHKAIPNVFIIITSKYPQYLIDGYKVEAKRYFLKPIDQNSFNYEMSTLLFSSPYKQRFSFFDPKVSKFKICYRDIYYVEFVGRVTFLHLINGKEIRCQYSLKQWNQMLYDKGFSQPYKSFIVNLSYVTGFSDDEKDILLTNNERIPISRHYKKAFEEDYYRNLHSIL